MKRYGQRVTRSHLTTNQRYWYTQHLCDALYREGWIRLQPRRINDSSNDLISIGGAVIPKPKLVEAYAPEHEKAFVPEARLYLGSYEYQDALATLSEKEWEGWWEWVQKRKDKWGRPLSAAVLFRSSGSRVIRNEHTKKEQQDAGLKILTFCWVECTVPLFEGKR